MCVCVCGGGGGGGSPSPCAGPELAGSSSTVFAVYFNLLFTGVAPPVRGWGERCGVFPLSPLLLPRFYFYALLFTSHRSPLSERLEQATWEATLGKNLVTWYKFWGKRDS